MEMQTVKRRHYIDILTDEIEQLNDQESYLVRGGLPHDAIVSSLDDFVGEPWVEVEDFEQVTQIQSGAVSAQKQLVSQRVNVIGTITQERDIAPALPQAKDKASIQTIEEIQAPVAHVQPTKLEIPGVSRASQPSGFPTGMQQVLAGTFTAQVETQAPIPAAKPTVAALAEDFANLPTEVATVFPMGLPRNVNASTKTVASEAKAGVRLGVLPKSALSEPSVQARPMVQPVQAVAPEELEISTPSAQRASDKLKELRQAVRELAAKPSTPPTETSQSAPPPVEQAPPPLTIVQPPLRVKAGSRLARLPRAFWERRYLSRFRLRTLR
jgi:hypothetical protein